MEESSKVNPSHAAAAGNKRCRRLAASTCSTRDQTDPRVASVLLGAAVVEGSNCSVKKRKGKEKGVPHFGRSLADTWRRRRRSRVVLRSSNLRTSSRFMLLNPQAPHPLNPTYPFPLQLLQLFLPQLNWRLIADWMCEIFFFFRGREIDTIQLPRRPVYYQPAPNHHRLGETESRCVSKKPVCLLIDSDSGGPPLLQRAVKCGNVCPFLDGRKVSGRSRLISRNAKPDLEAGVPSNSNVAEIAY